MTKAEWAYIAFLAGLFILTYFFLNKIDKKPYPKPNMYIVADEKLFNDLKKIMEKEHGK